MTDRHDETVEELRSEVERLRGLYAGASRHLELANHAADASQRRAKAAESRVAELEAGIRGIKITGYGGASPTNPAKPRRQWVEVDPISFASLRSLLSAAPPSDETPDCQEETRHDART